MANYCNCSLVRFWRGMGALEFSLCLLINKLRLWPIALFCVQSPFSTLVWGFAIITFCEISGNRTVYDERSSALRTAG